MLRKFVSAAIVVALVGSVTLAAEYRGMLTKAEDKDGKKKITVKVKKDKDDEGTDKVFTLATDHKVTLGKKKEGFFEDLTKALEDAKAKKGVRVTITTEGEGDKEMVTAVRVGGRGKKKKSDLE